MPITSGATVGPYKVDREIGRGGMGVVFLAQDTRLGRTVALKALPDDVASDPDRLQRFEREARVLASLNHPNVASIYGLEESEGRRYLALEHIEGETLADRLLRGSLPLHETIDVCMQIAAGMEAAHDGGVVHRDLKPANVMITPEDHVKVLDFGLAKGKVVTDESGLAKSPAIVDSPSSPTMTQSPTLPHSPTIVTPATLPGVILGTAAYLSPEQARGKAVDRRTDIWSFGCVLYECLTGRRAFEGETVSDTIAKILERDMDWSTLPISTPARLRELLERCLTKDPKRRLRDIGDARLTLEEIKSGRFAAGPVDAAAGPTPPAVLAARRRTLILIASSAALAGAMIGAAAWNVLHPGARPGAARPMHLSVPLPPGLQFQAAAVTPQGDAFIVVGTARAASGTEPPRARLYIRRFHQAAFEPLRGTEGAVPSLLVSPDGRWVAFAATPPSGQSGQLRLFKMPIDASGPPIPIGSYDRSWDLEATWLASGDFIIATEDGAKYVRVSGDGTASAPRKFDLPGFNGSLRPQNPPLPGDRGIFLTAVWYERSVYCQGIAVMDPKSGKVKMLVRDGGSPQYSATGHLLFSRQHALLAAPFDLSGLKITGEPVGILDDLRPPRQVMHAPFGFTSNGMLGYVPGGDAGRNRKLFVADRGARLTEWSRDGQAWDYTISASPDGSRLVGSINSADGITELWISEKGRAAPYRLPVRPGADCAGAAWSPDGKRIAYFQWSQSADDGIYVSNIEGSSPPQRILTRSSPSMYVLSTTWSRDGSTILATLAEGTTVTICSFAASPSQGSRPTLKRLFSDDVLRKDAEFSPDGRLVAYESGETGKSEIYVCAWGGVGLVGRPLLVSAGGGRTAKWGAEGSVLYYVSPENKVMAVHMAAAQELSASSPSTVWDLEALKVPDSAIWGPMYDILPGGRMLGVQRAEGEDALTRFDVVLNFDDVLKQRMRAARR